jgi:hypothetical protein
MALDPSVGSDDEMTDEDHDEPIPRKRLRRWQDSTQHGSCTAQQDSSAIAPALTADSDDDKPVGILRHSPVAVHAMPAVGRAVGSDVGAHGENLRSFCGGSAGSDSDEEPTPRKRLRRWRADPNAIAPEGSILRQPAVNESRKSLGAAESINEDEPELDTEWLAGVDRLLFGPDSECSDEDGDSLPEPNVGTKMELIYEGTHVDLTPRKIVLLSAPTVRLPGPIRLVFRSEASAAFVLRSLGGMPQTEQR